MSALAPLPPLDPRGSFRPLGRALIELLSRLDAEQWQLATVCAKWRVRDIAAHLLDSGCRRLSFDRDRHPVPPAPTPIRGPRELVAFLDQLNADWVAASWRLSPALLVELLGAVETALAAWVEGVDLDQPALFPVAWAGDGEQRAWLDLARELTERWLHQHQIRLAVGAPPLADPHIDGQVFDAFARAWPVGLAGCGEPPGTRVAVALAGPAPRQYTLLRGEHGWQLLGGLDPLAEACVGLDAETAWLALTKGITGAEAGRRAVVDGRRDLAQALLGTLAVMA